MSGEAEIGVFINTSLGTRLALSVPPATTATLLIKEVETAHFNCLPCFGEIKVQGFMVKRRSCLYHLSPSAPLLCALRDCKGPCFLYATAVKQNACSTERSKTLGYDVSLGEQPFGTDGVECSMMTALERNLEQKCRVMEAGEAVSKESHLAGGHSGVNSMNSEKISSGSIGFPIPATGKKSHEHSSGVMMGNDCSSENSSATRSVSDIIRRHYSATDTLVESQYLPERKCEGSRVQFCAASPAGAYMTPKSPGFFMLQDAGVGRLSSEGKRPDVGQRLLMASSKLGLSLSKPSPVLSMYRSKGRKRNGADVQIRNPIFELSGSSG